ncbi:hypothetical protein IEQ34_006876 [Dendrobium chrysotoxum]|uniref:RNA exonuclease 4 n=1 Tax=Dendrobium chrysotoxum TaxID=161865 RepID=A0AAV7H9D8_DENCH|nr:hypothetical protein IEQ34_006876 [Dendrobium chrysotoxum]
MAKEGYGTTGDKAAAARNPNWASLLEKLKGRKPLVSSASLDNETRATSALGKRKERPDTVPAAPLSNPSILAPTSEDFSLTEALAMDCEMVGVSFQGNKSALGRVTLVNTWGNVVYDEYVRPIDYVVDFRTKISGIRPRNLKKAKEFSTVQKSVAEAIKGRILVGHALHNDLKVVVLLLSHPRKDTRDTAEYQPFLREGRRRALRDLAAEILGVKIQQKEHCSIEDARAAMFIYKKHKKEWEKSIMKQFRINKKHKNKHRKKSMPEQTPKAS